jgi:hypothetical protein
MTPHRELLLAKTKERIARRQRLQSAGLMNSTDRSGEGSKTYLLLDRPVEIMSELRLLSICAEFVDLLDDTFLRELSRKYGVSTQALVNRLKNLGYLQQGRGAGLNEQAPWNDRRDA